MGDEDEDEDVDDGPGVLRTADRTVALAPTLAPPPPEPPLTAEDGRDEAPMRSGRGGAPAPEPADRPARVALVVVVWAADAGPDGADAAVPPAEAASLRRRRAARASWADCFRAAGTEEVVSASILFIKIQIKCCERTKAGTRTTLLVPPKNIMLAHFFCFGLLC